jgi:hypothetical protein
MSEEKNAGSVVTSENAADFYAERLGLAEKPVKTVADEPEKAEAEPVESEERSEPTEADAAKPQEERKQNPKLEKRFSEITRQREEARKEAQREREARMQLEDRLRQLEQRAAPQVQQPSDSKPRPEQFKDAFEYAEALAEFTANLKIQQMKQETEREKFVKTWADKVTAVKDELPDFDDMVASSDVVVPDHVRDAIMDSENGAKLLYHLAENPEIAQKIAKLPPISALREIGKLEARFDAKPQETSAPVAKSKAPEPIKPIRASKGAVDVPLSSDGVWEGSYQAWKQARKAGKIR